MGFRKRRLQVILQILFSCSSIVLRLSGLSLYGFHSLFVTLTSSRTSFISLSLPLFSSFSSVTVAAGIYFSAQRISSGHRDASSVWYLQPFDVRTCIRDHLSCFDLVRCAALPSNGKVFYYLSCQAHETTGPITWQKRWKHSGGHGLLD